MNTITPEDVARKAIELAEANPDYIYEAPKDGDGFVQGCQYVNRDPQTGVPTGEGCIFGRALVELGVDPESIPEGGHVAATLKHLGITDFEVRRTTLLARGYAGDPLLVAMVLAQNNQDDKRPWGEAILPVSINLAATRQEVAA